MASLSLTSSAQAVAVDTAAAKAQLKQDAEKMAKFFNEKNYRDYVKYIYPKLLQVVGGEAKMMEALKGVMLEMDGYRETLFKKLNVSTRVGLVLYAVKNEMIEI